MHDIGKLAINDIILEKPAALSDDEMEIMKTHAEVGYEMLRHSNLELMQMAAVIAREHHEKFDGTGYPRGLEGDEINIVARIVALADVFDALGSKRVYKEVWEMDDILAFIKKRRATHFDPKLVDLFFENLDKVLEIHDAYRD
jgi:response regulator RpfG family c-di-GMP phosphodiesterase